MKRLSTYAITAALALSLALLPGCKPESGSAEQSAGEVSAEQSAVSSEEASAEASANDGDAGLSKVTGVVTDGAKSYIVIRDFQGEEHEFEYPDLDYDCRDAYQIGDTMVVTYVPNPELGDSVVTLRQSNPVKSQRYSMH